jgi:hypothetical protein
VGASPLMSASGVSGERGGGSVFGSPVPSLRALIGGGNVNPNVGVVNGANAGAGAGAGTCPGGVAGTGIMDEGGEWEREGLGTGLEERLDWVR